MDGGFSQPIGTWKARGAPDEYIRMALGETLSSDVEFVVDQEGFHLWHYWAESPTPELLWDDLRMRFGKTYDLTLSHNGEHPLYRLILKNKHKAALLWMKEAQWDMDLHVNHDTLWHALAWNGTHHFDELMPCLSPHNINDQDEIGLTAASIAVHRGGRDALKYWLFLGVDPNIPDQHNRTVLHHIALYGDISWFTEVQDMGADETLRNDRNQTAWALLQERIKHFNKEDVLSTKLHWNKRYFEKSML